MTTNAAAIAALVNAKAVLESRCNGASEDALKLLCDSINSISAEIGALEVNALKSASYLPATDAFKIVTASAGDFLKKLNKLRSEFDGVIKVAAALDSVINLVKNLKA